MYVLKKETKRRSHCLGTGGGSPINVPFCPLEEELLDFITPEEAGMENIPQGGIYSCENMEADDVQTRENIPQEGIHSCENMEEDDVQTRENIHFEETELPQKIAYKRPVQTK
ncbi:hypothetical protein X777_11049 [Ooceraea biroi]|nr:hypothetical protein X777_11049 [Ooceraea biroi]